MNGEAATPITRSSQLATCWYKYAEKLYYSIRAIHGFDRGKKLNFTIRMVTLGTSVYK